MLIDEIILELNRNQQMQPAPMLQWKDKVPTFSSDAQAKIFCPFLLFGRFGKLPNIEAGDC